MATASAISTPRTAKRANLGPLQHALSMAPPTFLDASRASLDRAGVLAAIRRHDSVPVFDWIMTLVPLQGISDAVAFAYAAEHGGVTWAQIEAGLPDAACQRLRSHWHFEGCGYRKGLPTCADPRYLAGCPLPVHPLRKGTLNQAAYSLFLFIRDVCGGDLISWIDGRLAMADPGPEAPGRGAVMRDALLAPLGHVHGIGSKLWSMMLADLLLTGDPTRERWRAAGASMVAVDTLVHNFMVRTGLLRRHGSEHPYGPGCYAPGGCAGIIEATAERIDARGYHPTFPAVFPRFVQFAMWHFCAADGLDICNGNRIDDRGTCGHLDCSAALVCNRIPLR